MLPVFNESGKKPVQSDHALNDGPIPVLGQEREQAATVLRASIRTRKRAPPPNAFRKTSPFIR